MNALCGVLLALLCCGLALTATPRTVNPRVGKWTKTVLAQGQKNPLPRYGHSASVSKHSMLVFGGVVLSDDEAETTNSVLRFDFETSIWSVLSAHTYTSTPIARSGHGAAVVSDGLYIFGGQTSNGTKLNDLWKLNTTSGVWHLLHSGLPRKGESTEHGPTVPSSRTEFGFCACPLNTPVGIQHNGLDVPCLMMFGGRDDTGIKNDIWQFDLGSMDWHLQILHSTIAPLPRTGATLVPSSTLFTPGNHWEQPLRAKQRLPQQTAGASVILLGGAGTDEVSRNDLWAFHLVTGEWSQIEVVGDVVVSSRDGHAAAVFDNRLFVFGGSHNEPSELGTDSNELAVHLSNPALWQFSFATRTWQLILSNNMKHPLPRLGHTLSVFGGTLWLYGGMAQNAAYGDIWQFSIGSDCPNQCVHGECDFATSSCLCANVTRWAGPSCNTSALPNANALSPYPSNAISDPTNNATAPGATATSTASNSSETSFGIVDVELDACHGRCAPRGVCDTNSGQCFCHSAYTGDTCDELRPGNWLLLDSELPAPSELVKNIADTLRAAANKTTKSGSSGGQGSTAAAAQQQGGVAPPPLFDRPVPPYSYKYGLMPSGFYSRYNDTYTNVTDPALNANYLTPSAQVKQPASAYVAELASRVGYDLSALTEEEMAWLLDSVGSDRSATSLPKGWYAHTAVAFDSRSKLHSKMYVFGGALAWDASDEQMDQTKNFKKTGLLKHATNKMFEVELQIDLPHPPAPVSTYFQPNPPFVSRISEVFVAGDIPAARYDHTAFAFNGSMYIFGGVDPSHAGSPKILSDMWQFNTQSRTWSSVGQWVRDPKSPINKEQMSASQMGLTEKDRRTLSGSAWQPELGDVPSVLDRIKGRHGHCMVQVTYPHPSHPTLKSSAILFGGIDDQGQVKRDMWEFNLETHAWLAVQPHPHVTAELDKAEIPSARSHHVCVVLDGSKGTELVVAGGLDSSRSSLADMWLYDIHTNTWSRVAPLPFAGAAGSKDPGVGRRDHFALASVRKSVYLFGGVSSDGNLAGTSFDTVLVPAQLWRWTKGTNRWVRILGMGESTPSSRVGMSIVSSKGSFLTMFGGVGLGMAKSELWTYHAGKHCGAGCTIEGQCDEEHSHCVCNEHWRATCTVGGASESDADEATTNESDDSTINTNSEPTSSEANTSNSQQTTDITISHTTDLDQQTPETTSKAVEGSDARTKESDVRPNSAAGTGLTAWFLVVAVFVAFIF